MFDDKENIPKLNKRINNIDEQNLLEQGKLKTPKFNNLYNDNKINKRLSTNEKLETEAERCTNFLNLMNKIDKRHNFEDLIRKLNNNNDDNNNNDFNKELTFKDKNNNNLENNNIIISKNSNNKFTNSNNNSGIIYNNNEYNEKTQSEDSLIINNNEYNLYSNETNIDYSKYKSINKKNNNNNFSTYGNLTLSARKAKSKEKKNKYVPRNLRNAYNLIKPKNIFNNNNENNNKEYMREFSVERNEFEDF